MISRLTEWTEALSLLPVRGATLAIGGNSIHRVPSAFLLHLLKSDVRDLHLVKTAGAWDIDLLCLAHRVSAVSAGFVGYEAEFGLARHYRKAVESGSVEAREHACYTVITSLRAAAYGLPWMPVRGLDGSDLVEARGFARVADPYGGPDAPVAIPAIQPDLAVIHVQYADEHGNGVILGPKYEDPLMARAATRVLLTVEEIVPTENLPVPLDHVDIPAVLTSAVVHAPGGAFPASCAGRYPHDSDTIQALISLADPADLPAYAESLLQREAVS